MRVGLTGGIGAGKSAVAHRLAQLGALVIDSDVLAREVVAPGSAGLDQIRARFGEEMVTAEGTLDRPALGAVVFADARARADLEQITHPLIRARSREIEAGAEPGRVVVHDIPLLVEKGMAAAFDLVLVVGASETTRVGRLVRTRGITHEQALQRVRAQASDEQRRAVADVWVDNEGTLEELFEQVDRVWRERIAVDRD